MRRYIVIAAALLLCGPVYASPITPTSAEKTALQALGTTLPTAKLLWVRANKIYYSPVANFKEQLATTGGYSEENARWSPDGTQILFVRIGDGVYVMKADFTGKTKVIAGGNTASWTRDGKSITAVDSTGYKVVKYDLATKTQATIYDAKVSPYNGQKVSQAAELRKGGRFLLVFRLTPQHVTEVVDLQSKKYLANTEMKRGDCSPAWAPDGSYFMTTARLGSRPVLKTDLNASVPSVSASKHYVGLATSYKFYIHGQRVSNDGKYVAFGGKIFSGPVSNGDREIYIWKIGDPEKNAVRMSFETNEDRSPSLYIPPTGSTPKLVLSPTLVTLSATEGGSDPASKTVNVSNAGSGTLGTASTTVSYGSGGSGWLTTTVGGSGNSQTVANKASISGLTANTYSATVKVASSGASNSPQSFTVILTVKEKPKLDAGVTADSGTTKTPKLSLSPTTVSFVAQAGASAPSAKTVKVSNSGSGTFKTVKATTSYLGGSSGWLTVSASGSGNSQTLSNSVKLTGLTANTYSATVSISEASASNSPQTYVVTLTLSDKPILDAGVTDDTGAAGDAGGTAGEGTIPTGDGGVNAEDALTLEGGCGCQVAGPSKAPILLLFLLVIGVLRRVN